MPISTFENLTGRTINGLQVQSIARRQPEIAWHAVCTKCGTQQTQRHVLLTHGSASCADNGCGRTAERQTRGSAIAVREGGRTASNVERRAFEAEQQLSQPLSDPQADQRRAQRIEDGRREVERVREPYKRYYWHQLERGAQPMTLQQFVSAGEYAQQRIMEIVTRDENGGKG